MIKNLVECAISFIRATTRPFVTYALVGAVIYGVVVGSIEARELLTLAATAVGFWFGDRKTRTEGQA